MAVHWAGGSTPPMINWDQVGETGEDQRLGGFAVLFWIAGVSRIIADAPSSMGIDTYTWQNSGFDDFGFAYTLWGRYLDDDGNPTRPPTLIGTWTVP